jgi:hypothetical protein
MRGMGIVKIKKYLGKVQMNRPPDAEAAVKSHPRQSQTAKPGLTKGIAVRFVTVLPDIGGGCSSADCPSPNTSPRRKRGIGRDWRRLGGSGSGAARRSVGHLGEPNICSAKGFFAPDRQVGNEEGLLAASLHVAFHAVMRAPRAFPGQQLAPAPLRPANGSSIHHCQLTCTSIRRRMPAWRRLS